MASPRDCPCSSGARYAACCAPLHRGEREAETPEALLRSRFAAYALGLGPYLLATLTGDHEDRSLDAASLMHALSQAKGRIRFLALRVLDQDDPAARGGTAGEVLFFARIFERGVDCSFYELSQFRREGSAWRYASGDALPVGACAEAPVDRAAFRALVARARQSTTTNLNA